MWEPVKISLPGGSLMTQAPVSSFGCLTDLLTSPLLQTMTMESLEASSPSARSESGKESGAGVALMMDHLVISFGAQSALFQRPRLQAATPESLRNPNTNAVPLGHDGQPLRCSITVTPLPQSTVFLVSATGSDPIYTQRYLDALLNQFLFYNQEIRRASFEPTPASVSEQLQKLERDWKSDQEMLMAFQQTNHLAVLQAYAARAADYLMSLSVQLSDLQREDRLLQRRDLSQAEAAFRETISLRIEHVQDCILEWDKKLTEINLRLAEGERLQQNVRRSQGSFDQMLTLLERVDIARCVSQETLSILEPASPAERTRTLRTGLLAVAGGVGLGVGLGIVALLGLARGIGAGRGCYGRAASG